MGVRSTPAPLTAPGTADLNDELPTGQSADLLGRILSAAADYPSRLALSGPHGRTLRYRDLAVAIVATAKRLRSNDFRPGDRLVSGLRPSPAAVVLTLGAIAAGGTVVVPEPGTGGHGFATAAELAAPHWLAADAARWAVRPFRTGTQAREWRRPVSGDQVRGTVRNGPWLPGVPSGSISARSLAHGRGPSERLTDLRVATQTPALILFTSSPVVPLTSSSTTPVPDRPRGVLHTRESLGVNLVVAAYAYEMDRRSRVYLDDLLIGLSALAVGAHWRLPSPTLRPRADPARFAKSIGRATHVHLGPADLTAVLTAVGEGLAPTPTALRQVLVPSPTVSPGLETQTAAILPNVALLRIYGLPEMCPIAVGGAGTSMELLDGISARTTRSGELVVSGPSLSPGYLGDAATTEHRTGDLAVLTDRRVTLLGPRDDVIRRDRTLYHPETYRAAVETLPGVGHAALVETPDDTGGHQLVLAVQPAGQPVNDRPLAGEPKLSNSRDDAQPERQQISVLLDHPLASTVAAGLADVVGKSASPDRIVVLSALPVGPDGRSDRAALAAVLADPAAWDLVAPVRRTS